MSQQRTFVVERITGPCESDHEAVNALLPQLSSSAKPLNYADFARMVTDDANRVYVARTTDEHRTIVGVMILVVVRQLVGIKCWIEDVVVDGSCRGQGIAHAMMAQAIADAPEDAKHINLTSKPDRGAAHSLYYRLGFQVRDTAVFRLTLQ